jgi:hypothetical protein
MLRPKYHDPKLRLSHALQDPYDVNDGLLSLIIVRCERDVDGLQIPRPNGDIDFGEALG